MWSEDEISRILEIFPDALDSDVLIPRPTERPSLIHKKAKQSGLNSDEQEINERRQKTVASLVDPIWETLDPTPDIRALFMQFDQTYFDGKLTAVEIRWSPRMTLCAGLCCYEGRGGLCSIRLSEPLLKLRPRSDLIETLLHEMIHAFLFVTEKDRVFHTFHREVENYQKHWWRCTGVCRQRPPFFGYVKRAMNRAPGPNDTWWGQHQALCQGHFVKIKEPEKVKRSGSGGKKSSSSKSSTLSAICRKKRILESSGEKPASDIRSFLHTSTAIASTSVSHDNPKAESVNRSPSQSDLQPVPTQPEHCWPESGHVLGGVCKPNESRLLMLDSKTELAKRPLAKVVDPSAYVDLSPSPEMEHESVYNPNLTTCPVCSVLIPLSQINRHLDICLL
ncbi:unnamed protein product [Echinostoma caproni]|uniref:Protein with SprT-like domain at the N terminus n=1 Tax=Echinostoma caproni TaxID=27848 RepID=A0A183AUW8_9TREM|nr:unnamed protein product [Echinostoma caproni]